MRHEKEIKRPNGKLVKITIQIYVAYSEPRWMVSVLHRSSARKKKWEYFKDDSWEVRHATNEEREKMEREYVAKHVSAEEIHAAKMDLWEKMKPEPLAEIGGEE